MRRLLVVQHLESSGSNFELNLLVNREPVQANQNRCDVTKTRFLSNKQTTWGECFRKDLELLCLEPEWAILRNMWMDINT